MVIYGTNSKDLGTKKIPGAKCPNCDANEIHVQAVSRYATLFWIPVFPYAKKLFSVCGNCEQVLEKKQMPQQLKDKIDMEKSNFKTPFYLYAGAIIIALLIGFGIYSSGQHDKELAENVKNLQSEQIIVFKEKSKEYSFAKVVEVKGDTIFANFAQYVYEGGYSAPTISEFNSKKAGVTDFYSEELSYYLQSEIDSLHKEGLIVEIYK